MIGQYCFVGVLFFFVGVQSGVDFVVSCCCCCFFFLFSCCYKKVRGVWVNLEN